ncbi:D-2-hydroxyacid dehydrogenase [Paraburkholderia tropica]|uniref:D-2-hydroxyacid dehydrogenase n=1 Tax=Paraburkholderia tropica TaxID=92647 RepID=UPI002AB6FF98|nr:D-2-hydroxyacid dehydrogenase [Paraburkholderia tropica]
MTEHNTIAANDVPLGVKPDYAPVRVMISDASRTRIVALLDETIGVGRYVIAGPNASDFDVAFVSRDITGRSTKHQIEPETQVWYDRMLGAASLRWVHIHAAGADREVYLELLARGVTLTTSAGSNAIVVAHTALAAMLALARVFPHLLRAQREHRWASLFGGPLPRDIAGQTAVLVGWGRIGQTLGALLCALGMHVIAVRREVGEHRCADGVETVAYAQLDTVLPRADWLVLACPLTSATRNLIDHRALSLLPRGAHLVNVARGEIVVEPALVDALTQARLAGAYLDVFAHEPLSTDSPLWDMENVIVTPHSAGFSDGNEGRVDGIFVENLSRWLAGQPMSNVVASAVTSI